MRASLETRGAAVVGLLIAAIWTLRWYALRLTDGSDEPWGLAALLAALWLAPRETWKAPLGARQRVILCVLLAVCALASAVLPPLLRALILVSGIAFVLGPAGFPVAWWALLALSLPVVASLNFYVGYPLRWLTALTSVPLLRAAGFAVRAVGVTLEWAGEQVVVDAPCSGVRMLWTGFFLSALLACGQRFGSRATWALFLGTGAIVFAANIGRASALFWLETGGSPHSSTWAHEAVGLSFFAAAALGIVRFAQRLGRRRVAAGKPC